MLMAESAYGKMTQADQADWNWWGSGAYGDTIFMTLYPMNPFTKLANQAQANQGPKATAEGGDADDLRHEQLDRRAGGVELPPRRGQRRASATGRSSSSRTRSTRCPTTTTLGCPIGLTQADHGHLLAARGAQWGVWQALSTARGGEVIGADQY